MITKNESVLSPKEKDSLDNIPIEVMLERLQHYLQNHQTIDIGIINCKVVKSTDHNHE